MTNEAVEVTSASNAEVQAKEEEFYINVEDSEKIEQRSSVKSECSETESARPAASTSPMSSQDDEPDMEDEPRRPPRAIDGTEVDIASLNIHPDLPSYCNLPKAEPPPPTLPRRQPHMRRSCTSPTLSKSKGLPPPPPPLPTAITAVQRSVKPQDLGPLEADTNIYQNQIVHDRLQLQSSTLPYRRRIQARKKRSGTLASFDACQCSGRSTTQDPSKN